MPAALAVAGSAGVGALIGVTASVAFDLIGGRPVSWKSALAGAAGGATAGALLFTSAGGVLARTAGGALAAGGGSAVHQATDNVLHDRPWSKDVGHSAVMGSALGAAFVGLPAAAGAVKRSGGLGAAVERTGDATNRALRSVQSKLGQSAVGRGFARVGQSPFGQKMAAAKDAMASKWGPAVDSVKGAGSRTAAALGKVTPEPVKKAAASVGNAAHSTWKGYLNALDGKYALPTKAATAGVLMGTGDLIAQKIEGKDQIDWKRTAILSTFGVVWVGPMGHYWVKYLNRAVPGTSLKAAAGRMVLDQSMMAPLPMYYIFTGALEGKSPDQIGKDIKATYWEALKANYMIWPAFQLVNFRYVPQRLQVGAVNVGSLGWSAYLSMITKGDAAQAKAQGKPAPAEKKSGDEGEAGGTSLAEDELPMPTQPEQASAEPAETQPTGIGGIGSLRDRAGAE